MEDLLKRNMSAKVARQINQKNLSENARSSDNKQQQESQSETQPPKNKSESTTCDYELLEELVKRINASDDFDPSDESMPRLQNSSIEELNLFEKQKLFSKADELLQTTLRSAFDTETEIQDPSIRHFINSGSDIEPDDESEGVFEKVKNIVEEEKEVTEPDKTAVELFQKADQLLQDRGNPMCENKDSTANPQTATAQTIFFTTKLEIHQGTQQKKQVVTPILSTTTIPTTLIKITTTVSSTNKIETKIPLKSQKLSFKESDKCEFCPNDETDTNTTSQKPDVKRNNRDLKYFENNGDSFPKHSKNFFSGPRRKREDTKSTKMWQKFNWGKPRKINAEATGKEPNENLEHTTEYPKISSESTQIEKSYQNSDSDEKFLQGISVLEKTKENDTLCEFCDKDQLSHTIFGTIEELVLTKPFSKSQAKETKPDSQTTDSIKEKATSKEVPLDKIKQIFDYKLEKNIFTKNLNIRERLEGKEKKPTRTTEIQYEFDKLSNITETKIERFPAKNVEEMSSIYVNQWPPTADSFKEQTIKLDFLTEEIKTTEPDPSTANTEILSVVEDDITKVRKTISTTVNIFNSNKINGALTKNKTEATEEGSETFNKDYLKVTLEETTRQSTSSPLDSIKSYLTTDSFKNTSGDDEFKSEKEHLKKSPQQQTEVIIETKTNENTSFTSQNLYKNKQSTIAESVLTSEEITTAIEDISSENLFKSLKEQSNNFNVLTTSSKMNESESTYTKLYKSNTITTSSKQITKTLTAQPKETSSKATELTSKTEESTFIPAFSKETGTSEWYTVELEKSSNEETPTLKSEIGTGKEIQQPNITSILSENHFSVDTSEWYTVELEKSSKYFNDNQVTEEPIFTRILVENKEYDDDDNVISIKNENIITLVNKTLQKLNEKTPRGLEMEDITKMTEAEMPENFSYSHQPLEEANVFSKDQLLSTQFVSDIKRQTKSLITFKNSEFYFATENKDLSKKNSGTYSTEGNTDNTNTSGEEELILEKHATNFYISTQNKAALPEPNILEATELTKADTEILSEWQEHKINEESNNQKSKWKSLQQTPSVLYKPEIETTKSNKFTSKDTLSNVFLISHSTKTTTVGDKTSEKELESSKFENRWISFEGAFLTDTDNIPEFSNNQAKISKNLMEYLQTTHSKNKEETNREPDNLSIIISKESYSIKPFLHIGYNTSTEVEMTTLEGETKMSSLPEKQFKEKGPTTRETDETFTTQDILKTTELTEADAEKSNRSKKKPVFHKSEIETIESKESTLKDTLSNIFLISNSTETTTVVENTPVEEEQKSSKFDGGSILFKGNFFTDTDHISELNINQEKISKNLTEDLKTHLKNNSSTEVQMATLEEETNLSLIHEQFKEKDQTTRETKEALTSQDILEITELTKADIENLNGWQKNEITEESKKHKLKWNSTQQTSSVLYKSEIETTESKESSLENTLRNIFSISQSTETTTLVEKTSAEEKQGSSKLEGGSILFNGTFSSDTDNISEFNINQDKINRNLMEDLKTTHFKNKAEVNKGQDNLSTIISNESYSVKPFSYIETTVLEETPVEEESKSSKFEDELILFEGTFSTDNENISEFNVNQKKISKNLMKDLETTHFKNKEEANEGQDNLSTIISKESYSVIPFFYIEYNSSTNAKISTLKEETNMSFIPKKQLKEKDQTTRETKKTLTSHDILEISELTKAVTENSIEWQNNKITEESKKQKPKGKSTQQTSILYTPKKENIESKESTSENTLSNALSISHFTETTVLEKTTVEEEHKTLKFEDESILFEGTFSTDTDNISEFNINQKKTGKNLMENSETTHFKNKEEANEGRNNLSTNISKESYSVKPFLYIEYNNSTEVEISTLEEETNRSLTPEEELKEKRQTTKASEEALPSQNTLEIPERTKANIENLNGLQKNEITEKSKKQKSKWKSTQQTSSVLYKSEKETIESKESIWEDTLSNVFSISHSTETTTVEEKKPPEEERESLKSEGGSILFKGIFSTDTDNIPEFNIIQEKTSKNLMEDLKTTHSKNKEKINGGQFNLSTIILKESYSVEPFSNIEYNSSTEVVISTLEKGTNFSLIPEKQLKEKGQTTRETIETPTSEEILETTELTEADTKNSNGGKKNTFTEESKKQTSKWKSTQQTLSVLYKSEMETIESEESSLEDTLSNVFAISLSTERTTVVAKTPDEEEQENSKFKSGSILFKVTFSTDTDNIPEFNNNQDKISKNLMEDLKTTHFKNKDETNERQDNLSTIILKENYPVKPISHIEYNSSTDVEMTTLEEETNMSSVLKKELKEKSQTRNETKEALNSQDILEITELTTAVTENSNKWQKNEIPEEYKKQKSKGKFTQQTSSIYYKPKEESIESKESTLEDTLSNTLSISHFTETTVLEKTPVEEVPKSSKFEDELILFKGNFSTDTDNISDLSKDTHVKNTKWKQESQKIDKSNAYHFTLTLGLESSIKTIIPENHLANEAKTRFSSQGKSTVEEANSSLKESQYSEALFELEEFTSTTLREEELKKNKSAKFKQQNTEIFPQKTIIYSKEKDYLRITEEEKTQLKTSKEQAAQEFTLPVGQLTKKVLVNETKKINNAFYSSKDQKFFCELCSKKSGSNTIITTQSWKGISKETELEKITLFFETPSINTQEKKHATKNFSKGTFLQLQDSTKIKQEEEEITESMEGNSNLEEMKIPTDKERENKENNIETTSILATKVGSTKKEHTTQKESDLSSLAKSEIILKKSITLNIVDTTIISSQGAGSAGIGKSITVIPKDLEIITEQLSQNLNATLTSITTVSPEFQIITHFPPPDHVHVNKDLFTLTESFIFKMPSKITTVTNVHEPLEIVDVTLHKEESTLLGVELGEEENNFTKEMGNQHTRNILETNQTIYPKLKPKISHAETQLSMHTEIKEDFTISIKETEQKFTELGQAYKTSRPATLKQISEETHVDFPEIGESTPCKFCRGKSTMVSQKEESLLVSRFNHKQNHFTTKSERHTHYSGERNEKEFIDFTEKGNASTPCEFCDDDHLQITHHEKDDVESGKETAENAQHGELKQTTRKSEHDQETKQVQETDQNKEKTEKSPKPKTEDTRTGESKAETEVANSKDLHEPNLLTEPDFSMIKNKRLKATPHIAETTIYKHGEVATVKTTTKLSYDHQWTTAVEEMLKIITKDPITIESKGKISHSTEAVEEEHVKLLTQIEKSLTESLETNFTEKQSEKFEEESYIVTEKKELEESVTEEIATEPEALSKYSVEELISTKSKEKPKTESVTTNQLEQEVDKGKDYLKRTREENVITLEVTRHGPKEQITLPKQQDKTGTETSTTEYGERESFKETEETNTTKELEEVSREIPEEKSSKHEVKTKNGQVTNISIEVSTKIFEKEEELAEHKKNTEVETLTTKHEGLDQISITEEHEEEAKAETTGKHEINTKKEKGSSENKEKEEEVTDTLEGISTESSEEEIVATTHTLEEGGFQITTDNEVTNESEGVIIKGFKESPNEKSIVEKHEEEAITKIFSKHEKEKESSVNTGEVTINQENVNTVIFKEEKVLAEHAETAKAGTFLKEEETNESEEVIREKSKDEKESAEFKEAETQTFSISPKEEDKILKEAIDTEITEKPEEISKKNPDKKLTINESEVDIEAKTLTNEQMEKGYKEISDKEDTIEPEKSINTSGKEKTQTKEFEPATSSTKHIILEESTKETGKAEVSIVFNKEHTENPTDVNKKNSKEELITTKYTSKVKLETFTIKLKSKEKGYETTESITGSEKVNIERVQETNTITENAEDKILSTEHGKETVKGKQSSETTIKKGFSSKYDEISTERLKEKDESFQNTAEKGFTNGLEEESREQDLTLKHQENAKNESLSIEEKSKITRKEKISITESSEEEGISVEHKVASKLSETEEEYKSPEVIKKEEKDTFERQEQEKKQKKESEEVDENADKEISKEDTESEETTEEEQGDDQSLEEQTSAETTEILATTLFQITENESVKDLQILTEISVFDEGFEMAKVTEGLSVQNVSNFADNEILEQMVGQSKKSTAGSFTHGGTKIIIPNLNTNVVGTDEKAARSTTKSMVIIVNNSGNKIEKINDIMLEKLLNKSVSDVDLEYIELHNVSDGTTEKNVSDLYIGIPVDKCEEKDFETNNNCLCNIQQYLHTISEKIKNKDDIHSKTLYCYKFVRPKDGLLIQSKSKPLTRKRRSLLYLKTLENLHEVVEHDSLEGLFVDDYKLDMSEEILPEKGNILTIHHITTNSSGNYSCCKEEYKENPEKIHVHELEVITFPIYDVQMNIFYQINATCELSDADILYSYLPKIVGSLLCSNDESVCNVKLERPRCVNREDDTFYNVSISARVSPDASFFNSLDSDQCDINCKLKVYNNLVSLVNRNAEAIEHIPVHSELPTSSTSDFVPYFSTKVKSFVDTKPPKILVSCPGGFGLESKRQSVCVVCPKHTFSADDEAFCKTCPPGQYQPQSGSKLCIHCNSPVDDSTCLRMLYSDTKLFKIYVGMAFGILIFLLIGFALWSSSSRDQPEPVKNTYFEGSLRHRAMKTRKATDRDLESGVREPLLGTPQRRKHAPELPPVDF